MQARRRNIRVSALLVTRTVLSLDATAAQLNAQEAARAEVPGVYAAEACGEVAFPAQLPPLASVFDTASITAALMSTGVDNRVLFALRLGAVETKPRVRVIEKKVAGSIAERAAAAVEAALREVPPDRDWAFRLRVEVDHRLTLSLERSRLCAAAPNAPNVGRRTTTMTADEFARLQGEIEERASRRRALRHRVLVDATGRVALVELVNSSGDASFDGQEAASLRRRRFTPSKLDDVPVSAWIDLRGDYGLSRR